MTAEFNKPVRIMDFRGTYKGGGGPDKTILLSALLHDKNRVDVLVTYLHDPRDDEFQIMGRAEKLGIPFEQVWDKFLLDFSCLSRLNRLIKKNGLELLHAHDDKTLLYGWLLKIINPNLKIAYTCHLYLSYARYDFHSSAAYYNFVIRQKVALFLTKRFLKPIMAVSEGTKRQLITNGLKKDDVIVLHNGIDVDWWQRQNGQATLRKELNLTKDEFLVGTVARIDYQKDFPTFFRVAQSVKAQIPNCKFVVVGDGKGDELIRIMEISKKMGLDNVIHFTGHRNDLLDIYSSFDLFLMTSVMEGLPNTVLEAMSMELPVVSTNIAGVPELVVDGETGYLCQIEDVESLSECVVKLLVNNILRERFARAGRQRVVDHFSFKDRVRKLEDLYEYYASA